MSDNATGKIHYFLPNQKRGENQLLVKNWLSYFHMPSYIILRSHFSALHILGTTSKRYSRILKMLTFIIKWQLKKHTQEWSEKYFCSSRGKSFIFKGITNTLIYTLCHDQPYLKLKTTLAHTSLLTQLYPQNTTLLPKHKALPSINEVRV